MNVAGEGIDENVCRTLSNDLKLNNSVAFHGQIPLYKVQKLYQEAHLFVFPSIREPSGNAVLEAMSYGLPVITTTLGGPGHVVNEKTGLRYNPSTPNQLVQFLVKSITFFQHHPEKLLQMGQAARNHIAHNYLWPKKIDWMLNLYDKVMSTKANIISTNNSAINDSEKGCFR